MAGFDLASVLRSVSESDTAEQIAYIDLEQIDPDPYNFYSLDGLDTLAANIETVGLQQPLRVRPGEDGRYIVVSGHRRRAACLMIRDGGSEQFKNGVPCIVEYGEASDALRRLRLIFANSATRDLTSAELSRQAEEVEKLLYELQEQGMEFKGRMRDHVAKACAVSKSKIARLHAIRNNLVPELLEEFDAGRINESVAYRISQEKPKVQKQLAARTGPSIRDYDINRVETAISMVKNPTPTQPVTFDGHGHIEWDGREYLEKLHQEDEEFAEMLQAEADALIRSLSDVKGRQDGIEQLKTVQGKSRHGWSTKAGHVNASPKGLSLWKGHGPDIQRSWTEVYDLLSAYAINKTAKAPAPKVSELNTAPTWQTGDPPAEGRYHCTVDLGSRLSEQKCDWKDGRWTAYGRPVDDVFTVIAWCPLPKDLYIPSGYYDTDDEEIWEEETEE